MNKGDKGDKGDKVICIQDVIFDYSDNIYFRSGVEYTAKYHNYGGIICAYVSNDVTVAFYLKDKISNYKRFSDYFITLVEWRDKQIDSILNE